MSSPMTRVRVRTATVGAAVATTAAVLVGHGSVLGDDLPGVALLGVAAGAVLALVPGRAGDAAPRVLALAAGFAASMVGLALQAGSLPDTATGRALAVTVVVSLVVALSVATADRVPLWAGLLSTGTFAGAFATVTGGAVPTTSTAVTALTCALLAAGTSFLVTTVLLLAAAAPADETAGDAGEVAGELPDVHLPAPRAAADRDAASTSKAVL